MTPDEIKDLLLRKDENRLDDAVDKYRNNYIKLFKNPSIESETNTPPEYVHLINTKSKYLDLIKPQVHCKTTGQRAKLNLNTSNSFALAQCFLDELVVKNDAPSPPEQGNWMSFENYIPGWYVGDQGSLPSCNGWAIADGILTFLHYKRKHEDLSHERIFLSNQIRFEVCRDLLPSVRHVWAVGKDLSTINTFQIISDSGSSRLFQTAINLADNCDVASRDLVPYILTSPFIAHSRSTHHECDKNGRSCFLSANHSKRILLFNIFSNQNVFKDGAESLDDAIPFIKSWLQNVGPLALELYVPKNLRSIINFNRNDIPEIPIPDSSNIDPTMHTVCIVGYTKNENQEEHLIIRNSYGLRWGHFGQAKISTSYLRNTSIRCNIMSLSIK